MLSTRFAILTSQEKSTWFSSLGAARLGFASLKYERITDSCRTILLLLLFKLHAISSYAAPVKHDGVPALQPCQKALVGLFVTEQICNAMNIDVAMIS